MTTEKPPELSGQQGPATPAAEAPVRHGMAWRLRNYFLTGIVITAPIIITAYIAWQFVGWIDGIINPLIPADYKPETLLHVTIPGLGLVVVAILLTLVGFLAANILGRTLVKLGERVLNRMPVVRSIYFALKQIFETVFSQSSQSFKDVVLIEYPRRGIWTVAFVTGKGEGEVRRLLDQDVVTVFVPTTPNPTSGFMLFLPRAECRLLDMTVEEGLKLVISGGVLAPPDRGKDQNGNGTFGRAPS